MRPFLALRSYLPADHPQKSKEIGSEPTPGAFIDTMLALTEEWARLLAPHGSICVELGDTYSGANGWGDNNGNQRYPNGRAGGTPTIAAGPGLPLAKSLCLIPELYRIALVYGFNPLTGRQTPPWRARNVIRWCRPNPPVGALGDKFRPATSDMVVACKGAKRYFDLDAVRDPLRKPDAYYVRENETYASTNNKKGTLGPYDASQSAGAPPLDHWWHDTFDQDAWNISTEPYRGSHYATWPRDLLVKPIEAMCPRRVCRTCGKPSERITQVTRRAEKDDRQRRVKAQTYRLNGWDHPPEIGWEMDRETLGWTDCGHDDWRPGLVLDPFGGSGTTGVVATGHGRDCILIDLDSRNADLARERVGMFLEVEDNWPSEVDVPVAEGYL